MVTPRFIGKTELAGLTMLRLDGAAVVEQTERLTGFLRERLGAEAAAFFAEPVITRGDGESSSGISWYAATATDPTSFAKLRPDETGPHEAALRSRLQQLEPLLDDPQHGLLLRNALVVPDLANVMVTSDGVVLTNWGMVPAGGDTASAAVATFRATLGRFAPFAAKVSGPGWFTAITAPAAAAPPPAAAAAAAAAAAGEVPQSTARARAAALRSNPGPTGGGLPPSAPVPPAAPPPPPPRPSLLVPIASFAIVLLVALVALGAGFWFGWNALLADLQGSRRVVADTGMLDGAIAAQRQTNDALRRQIAEAQAAAGRDVCTPENPLGLPPPPEQTPINPANVPPAPPPAPGQPPGQSQPFQGNLVELLDRSVVLVLARHAQGSGQGSGFFIAPDLVVTNMHVVQKALEGEISVVNKQLGRLTRAEVIAHTPTGQPFRPDFAVLRVPGVSLPFLALSTQIKQLDNVVTAGFPAIISETDEAYDRLLKGDASSVPNMVVSSGEVSVIQSDQLSTRIIHLAPIHPGNSGGPLSDRCGRVVGVNTFGRTVAEQVAKIDFSLATAMLVEFLKANNVTFTEQSETCQPMAAAPPQPPAPPTPGPGPAPQTPAPQQGAPAK